MNAVVEARPMQPAIVQDRPAVTPMQMLQVALDQGADLAKLEQLMALQERWEANEARKAYVAAMAQFKRNPPEILKRKHVNFTTQKGTTDYMHATLADVCAAVIKGLADVGISHRWDVEQQNDRITVHCVLTHEQGHSERTTLTGSADQSGGKNAIQAIGSAVSYLQRYTLLAATGLATKDIDDDGRGASIDVITESQVADLRALLDETGANIDRFMKWAKVTSLDQIAAKNYNAIVREVRARARS